MKQKLLLLVLTFGMCVMGINSQTRKPVGKAKTQVKSTKLVPKDSREYKVEEVDGFEWYKVCKNGKYGAEDRNGNILIPYEYKDIWYFNVNNGELKNYPVFFRVYMGDYIGAYSQDGRSIIPVSRGYYNILPKWEENLGQYYTYTKKNGMYGLCDVNGRQLFEAPYDELRPNYSDGKFYYEAIKYVNGGKMFGIIDGNGEIIVPLQEEVIFDESDDFYISTKGANHVVLGSKKSIKTTQNVLIANKFEGRTSSNTSSSTNNAGGGTTKVIVEQHGSYQVWVPCGGCNGSGQCSTCFGTGTNMSGKSLCISCHGNGKCHYCAGQGGHNEIQTR